MAEGFVWIRFARDIKLGQDRYFSRTWYQVSDELAQLYVESYPDIAMAIAAERPGEEIIVGRDRGVPDFDAELEEAELELEAEAEIEEVEAEVEVEAEEVEEAEDVEVEAEEAEEEAEDEGEPEGSE